jgi:hypothetical protein
MPFLSSQGFLRYDLAKLFQVLWNTLYNHLYMAL